MVVGSTALTESVWECFSANFCSKYSVFTIFEQKMKVATFKTHWIHPDWHCQSVYGRQQHEYMDVGSTALAESVWEYFSNQLHMLNSSKSSCMWSSGHPQTKLNGHSVILKVIRSSSARPTWGYLVIRLSSARPTCGHPVIFPNRYVVIRLSWLSWVIQASARLC